MEEALQNRIVAELKKDAQDHPDLVSMDDGALQRFMANLLDKKTQSAKINDPEMGSALLALNYKEKRLICNAAFAAVRRLGVLGQIIADPDITEVMINGYQNIFVEKAGQIKKMDIQFEDAQELETIITKFVSQAGRSVNESEPIVDTHLDDGSRVNVVMPPVALNGPIVTIRRFPKDPMTMETLIARESITPEVAKVLELLVASKYNIFVCGGTGSGKTTFLNALSNFIPKDQRIITIEDSAELQIRNIDNLVRLETRNAGPDGKGAITIRDLIRSALRMRPDRIIVGEVRGAEALDMLQAMNTGHDGSLSTGHANSTKDMLRRLETMVLQGADLPLDAIRQQIASAVDIIIHLSRLRDKTRRTMQIVEVLDYDMKEKDYILNPIYEFVESERSTKSKVYGKLQRTSNPFKAIQKLENAGIRMKI